MIIITYVRPYAGAASMYNMRTTYIYIYTHTHTHDDNNVCMLVCSMAVQHENTIHTHMYTHTHTCMIIMYVCWYAAWLCNMRTLYIHTHVHTHTHV
jgi:hypothetical protein